jgi:hypothetical protein
MRDNMAIGIVLNKDYCYQDASSLEELRATYDLEGTIQTIKNLSQGDKKICLFIGRVGDEPLPEEEGVIWVSGDIGFATRPYSLKERIHIVHDFTDEEGLSRLHGLFDKIVVDQSTCKDLGDDFISCFARLLKPTSQSVLIFEKTPYLAGFSSTVEQPENHYANLTMPCSYLITDQENDDKYFKEYEKTNDLSQKGNDFRAFRQQLIDSKSWEAELADEDQDLTNAFRMYIIQKLRAEHNHPSLRNKAFEWATQNTKEHTEQIFQKVEYIEGRPYPYPTNYSTDKDAFFVATGIQRVRTCSRKKFQ